MRTFQGPSPSFRKGLRLPPPINFASLALAEFTPLELSADIGSSRQLPKNYFLGKKPKGGEKFMIDTLFTSEYEEEILNLIDNKDIFTRSDLQGIVTALVNKIMEKGYRIINYQEKKKVKI